MAYSLKQRTKEGREELFDPVRRKWVAKTPEEQVRQTFVLYLLNVRGIPISHISIEKAIRVNGMTQRYDLVVFDQDGKPWMVVECKAPHVELTQAVVEQAGRYNKTLRAPILGVTNGVDQIFFKIDYQTEEIDLL
ncbi:MAG: type I restriction enzyme HsdR N-terminal domain-containing protein [Bacteroidales bacterium]|nr:type I restriction enzyme HsdR N-terminal domain-containing protein [Bacteroidales bacterium]